MEGNIHFHTQNSLDRVEKKDPRKSIIWQVAGLKAEFSLLDSSDRRGEGLLHHQSP